MTQPLPGPVLSAGTLFYLFGDHVLPPAGRGSVVDLPYSGARVSAPDLAALALAASFWRLRQEQALVLQPTTTKVLFGTHPDVALALGPNLAPRGGYEDVVMRGVSQGGTRAAELVRRWLRRDSDHPELDVLALARQELVQAGVGHEADAGRGAVAGLLRGRTELRLDPDRARGQWETFWRLHQGWTAFWQGEQPLAGSLLAACRRAVDSRARGEATFSGGGAPD